MDLSYRAVFNKDMDISLKLGLNLLKDFPMSRKSLLKIIMHQKMAEDKRIKWEKEDIIVPPLLIVGTTKICNLNCLGCYASSNCTSSKDDMTYDEINKLLISAEEAGCSAVLLAGGEPLLCENWLINMSNHTNLLGLVFTNGTLFTEDKAKWFSNNRNMVPLFSIEGSKEDTDRRRGEGVSEHIDRAMNLLSSLSVPFGLSITTGRHNIDTVTHEDFIKPYIKLGCRLVIHVEYVPVDKNSELLALNIEDKDKLDKYCRKSTETNKAIFIAFPGDESFYDGCLAAGRGFVYINSDGSLEPCPFAPYSDRNVRNEDFIDALKSPLLKALRSESKKMHEGSGGCSLRNYEKWIKEIVL